ncbi:MAG: glycoside hydrolase family 44 protein [Fimbriimonas sp.]
MVLALSLLLASYEPVIQFSVDATARTPISPYIYGNNFPDWKTQAGLFTFVRMGGNRLTAYNWETNASNAGNDYQHQNDGYMGESNEPGWSVRQFVAPAQANGAVALVTVPTAGYVSADKNGGGDVNKTPNYLATRFHVSLPKKPGPLSLNPDTTDRVVYQDEFVNWVERTRKPSLPVWYSLDNEPDLWGSTHQRIWAKNPTYAQIVANNIAFATGIKRVAPKALVFGPANYGWQGFRTFQNAPDGNGRDFLDFYLAEMRQAEKKAGRRLVDVLDIHWYPEAKGGGKRIAFEVGDAATAAARIQAPRSLWDPTYVEDSWIEDTLGNKPIMLLPRVQKQIAANYPGTKFAITEYNYGAGKEVSGLLAQADVLGIFGRERLFAANAFIIAPTDIAHMAAFRAYRNFDGKGAKFGDLGLRATGGKPEATSLYAAVDSKNPGRLTLVAINKTKAPLRIQVNVRGFLARSGTGFTFAEGKFNSAAKSSPKVAKGVLAATLPSESVTTFELKK